jgi:hyaluronate lyase
MVELFTGILLEEEEWIWRAVTALKSVFRTVTDGDGFYADGSFVFHNFFPYTGNYGVVLLSDIADAFYLLKRTRWDFEDRERAMAARWAMQSFTPLLYGGGMMDMVRGRLISYSSSPSHAVGHRTMAAMLRLSQSVSSKDATTIRARIKGWWARGTALPYTSGLTLDLVDEARRLRHSRTPRPSVPRAESKVFASMDRAIHLRRNYGVGISMHSTRIQNYESINGNDLDGWHTSDGMVYLYDADLLQYDGNFWPTVDPERLPGTTVIKGSHPPEGQFGGSAAVGGTSLDCYSAVMMQLNVFQGRLQAKKSWFLFDNEIVALGADIKSTVAGKHIETIIANRRLTSARTRKLVRSKSGRWANLPKSTKAAPIGFVFTAHANVHARRARRTGSWHDIDSGLPREKLSATYQALWIDHGVKPRQASYEYVLLPGRDAAGTAAYAANPTVRILANTPDVQAVQHRTPGITAISFWKPGATAAGITASAICSVMVRRHKGRVLIAVSDPTQLNTRPIRLTFDIAVGKTVSTDARIKVLRRKPLTLSIHASGAAGKTLHAVFAALPQG